MPNALRKTRGEKNTASAQVREVRGHLGNE